VGPLDTRGAHGTIRYSRYLSAIRYSRYLTRASARVRLHRLGLALLACARVQEASLDTLTLLLRLRPSCATRARSLSHTSESTGGVYARCTAELIPPLRDLGEFALDPRHRGAQEVKAPSQSDS
jgi:hypothetical protein